MIGGIEEYTISQGLGYCRLVLDFVAILLVRIMNESFERRELDPVD
jgi:hypothetical protein